MLNSTDFETPQLMTIHLTKGEPLLIPLENPPEAVAKTRDGWAFGAFLADLMNNSSTKKDS